MFDCKETPVGLSYAEKRAEVGLLNVFWIGLSASPFWLFAWLPDLSEQDHQSCSGKSGTLPSLINPAQSNQANNFSLINPAQANQAGLPAWSIVLWQIRRSGKQRNFVRNLLKSTLPHWHLTTLRQLELFCESTYAELLNVTSITFDGCIKFSGLA